MEVLDLRFELLTRKPNKKPPIISFKLLDTKKNFMLSRIMKRRPSYHSRLRSKRSALELCPFKKAFCIRVFLEKPKKPNSSRRKLTKVKLSTKRQVRCHIPGDDFGKQPIQKFSTVLVNGSRAQDIPCAKYRVVRGKFDAKPVKDRWQARSRYGIKNPVRKDRRVKKR